LTLTNPVGAAVIWNEAVNGDLSNTNLGLFGAGTYAIKGSSYIDWGTNPVNDTDRFSFNLGNSDQIVGVSISTSNQVLSGALSLFDPAATLTNLTTFDNYVVTDLGFIAGNTLLPLPGDANYFGALALSSSCCSGSVYFDWEIGITVESIATVPVPAAAWLFGSALGLLGWMRRKTA